MEPKPVPAPRRPKRNVRSVRSVTAFSAIATFLTAAVLGVPGATASHQSAGCADTELVIVLGQPSLGCSVNLHCPNGPYSTCLWDARITFSIVGQGSACFVGDLGQICCSGSLGCEIRRSVQVPVGQSLLVPCFTTGGNGAFATLNCQYTAN